MLDVIMEIKSARESNNTITELQKENAELKKELEFYKSIKTHYSSLVGNMYVKLKNGEKIWVDRQKITTHQISQLDKDKEVLQWLEEIQTVRYNDRDW